MVKIKTDRTGAPNVPCPYCEDKWIGGCACIRCEHWKQQVLSAYGSLIVECDHEGTIRRFDVPLTSPPMRQQEVVENVLDKISLLVGVDETGKKEIIMSSPVVSGYGKPTWSVSLTMEEAGDIGKALVRESLPVIKVHK